MKNSTLEKNAPILVKTPMDITQEESARAVVTTTGLVFITKQKKKQKRLLAKGLSGEANEPR